MEYFIYIYIDIYINRCMYGRLTPVSAVNLECSPLLVALDCQARVKQWLVTAVN